MMNKHFNFLFCTLLFIAFACANAFAGLSVTPSVTNVVGVPGSRCDSYYEVKNTDETDFYVKTEIVVGKCFSENKNLDVNKIVQFEKDRYFIRAGETIKIPYKIFVGEDFKGSVSVRVGFKTERPDAEVVNIVISVPIYITVEGTENLDFDIDSVDLYNTDKKVSYKLVINNKGNIHIRHTGSIEIYYKDMKVREIFLQETLPTYCENQRTFSDVLIEENDLKKGKYTAVFKVNYAGKGVEKKLDFKVDKQGNIIVIKKK